MSKYSKRINQEMIVLARESRGMTQKELAQLLAVSSGWLSRVEGGLRGIKDEELLKLTEILGYPIDFFVQKEPRYGLGVTEVFHRKRRSVTDKTLTKVYAQISIRTMHLSKLLRGLEFGDVSIRPIDLEEFQGNPGDVARLARASWHVPKGPIQNSIEMIECHGGIVIPFDFETGNIDAISNWTLDMPPLFFVNVHIPTDRLRFTLCHELGHVIMHQHSVDPNMERQAHEFAAEFLMPEREIRPYLTDLSLEKLATLKPYWRVSMAALLMRARDLGEITPRRSRDLWMQMGKAGYRKREPIEVDIPKESPALQQQLVSVYRGEMKYSASELGRLLCLSKREVCSIYLDSDEPLEDEDGKAAVEEVENIMRNRDKG